MPAVLNLDAISYGNDPILGAGGAYVTFSVDNVSSGFPGGTGPADVFFNAGAGDGAPADIYLKSAVGGAPMPVPPAPFGCLGLGGNHILVDADGLMAGGPPPFPFPNTPGMGLIEPAGPPGIGGRDNLDQLDLSDFSFVGPIGPPPAGAIFFSVDPASVAALGGPVPPFATANSAADIFVTGGFAGAAILRFADAASLGLAVGDNIDALAVDYTSGAATWLLGLATDEIVISLAPGSPALAALPHHCPTVRLAGAADLFMKGAAVGSAPFAAPAPYLDAEEMGLCTPASGGCFLPIGDNVDEIDIVASVGIADLDGDLRADVVDTDDDMDGWGDVIDNCPIVFNPGQADNDGDTIGDDCDPDDDNDGVPDTTDNCQFTSNALQTNSDAGPAPPAGDVGEVGNGRFAGGAAVDDTVSNGDGQGDACDPDDDNDAIADGGDADPSGDYTYDDDNDGLPACLNTNLDPDCSDAGEIPCLATGAAGMTDVDGSDDGPSWDTNCDGRRDGLTAAFCGALVGDADGDGVPARAEVCKWGTSDGDTDSDNDGLTDCLELVDVNGDNMKTFLADVLPWAKAIQLAGTAFGKDGDFDYNGDNTLSFLQDLLPAAKAIQLTPPTPGGCAVVPGPPNP